MNTITSEQLRQHRDRCAVSSCAVCRDTTTLLDAVLGAPAGVPVSRNYSTLLAAARVLMHQRDLLAHSTDDVAARDALLNLADTVPGLVAALERLQEQALEAGCAAAAPPGWRNVDATRWAVGYGLDVNDPTDGYGFLYIWRGDADEQGTGWTWSIYEKALDDTPREIATCTRLLDAMAAAEEADRRLFPGRFDAWLTNATSAPSAPLAPQEATP